MVQRYLSKFLINSLGQIPEKELLKQRKRTLKRNFLSKWHCKLIPRKAVPNPVLINVNEKSQQTVHSLSSHLKMKSLCTWDVGNAISLSL